MEHARFFLNGQLLVIATRHSGFELFETYKCTQCNTELMKWVSFNIQTKKKGHPPADINMSMAVGMYTSGVNVYKLNEFCSSVGILSPSLTDIYKNNSLVKKEIMDVSRE